MMESTNLQLTQQNTTASDSGPSESMLELVEKLQEECEAIEGVYFEDNLIKSYPQYKVVPKYTLMEPPKQVKSDSKKQNGKKSGPAKQPAKVELDLTEVPLVEF